MDVFVARQAIFDRQLKVYGYELLSRSCSDAVSAPGKDLMASLQVITNSFLSIGMENVLAGKLAFVNFPQELLGDERALVLPPKTTVIEILETVEPEPAVIAACSVLRQKGYTLALDDFVPNNGRERFMSLVSILKVDFRATSRVERRKLVKRYGPQGLRMLAEKVETQAEFQEAREMGYDYFQGYFFARPVILARQEIPVCKLSHLRILQQIHRPELDYPAIEELIRREVSLASKLLRFINSALFAWHQPVQSIVQALAEMGDQAIRTWVSLAALPSLTVDKPDELMRTALIRARFCELLAPYAGLGHRMPEMFLIGLFSLLDVMLGRPLSETLAEIKLNGEIGDVLLNRAGSENRMAGVYAFVRQYEAGEWDALASTTDRLQLSIDRIPELYLDSLAWSEQVFRC
ncbi:MAG: HDOD domain-containing protein [Acidobacteriia bacterium]|nr:HDOD domain-containing protein [Terriglobia bacterium]